MPETIAFASFFSSSKNASRSPVGVGREHHAAGGDLDRARVQAQLLADQRERTGHQVRGARELADAQRGLRIRGRRAAELHLSPERRQLGPLDDGDAVGRRQVGGQHRLQAGAQRLVAADRARALEVDDRDADRGVGRGRRGRNGHSRDDGGESQNDAYPCASHTRAAYTLNTGAVGVASVRGLGPNPARGRGRGRRRRRSPASAAIDGSPTPTPTPTSRIRILSEARGPSR